MRRGLSLSGMEGKGGEREKHKRESGAPRGTRQGNLPRHLSRDVVTGRGKAWGGIPGGREKVRNRESKEALSSINHLKGEEV